MPTTAQRVRNLALCTVLTLVFAAPAALAQDYGAPAYDRAAAHEQITVQAPRYHPRRSAIGAPIREVAISRPVRFDDLDLATPWGAHVLRDRIRVTARELCNRLNFEYPVTASDSPPCYRTALQNAMYRADEAIADARGYAD
jgi:UrcA family protein